MDDREQRIREKAFLLWLDEGQPEGEHERHWALASELVTIEEGRIDGVLRQEETGAGEAPEDASEAVALTGQGEAEVSPALEEAAPQLEPAKDAEPAEAPAEEPLPAEVQADAVPAREEAETIAQQEAEPAPAKSGSIWGSLGFGWGSKNS